LLTCDETGAPSFERYERHTAARTSSKRDVHVTFELFAVLFAYNEADSVRAMLQEQNFVNNVRSVKRLLFVSIIN